MFSILPKETLYTNLAIIPHLDDLSFFSVQTGADQYRLSVPTNTNLTLNDAGSRGSKSAN